MLSSVVNDRPHLPRASRRPHSNELFPFSFTSLTICNSFTLNLFADPHPLNPDASILYKNIGGGQAAILASNFQRSNLPTIPASGFSYTLPSSVSCNSFVCHSYANCRGMYEQFPFWDSSHYKYTVRTSLFSFLALTNCKFRNPFVLLFMRNARGVPPPTRK
jgi:hypothetical protein